MVRTISSRGRQLLNALPAAGVSLLGAFLVVPLLSPGLTHNILKSSLWTQVNNAQGPIVGASALVCLIVLWLQRSKGGHHKHAKH